MSWLYTARHRTYGFLQMEQCNKDLFNKSYDITSYQAEHPGGDDILLQYGGMDATKKFASINHSVYALSLREPRLVGAIEDGPVPVSYQEKITEIKKQVFQVYVNNLEQKS